MDTCKVLTVPIENSPGELAKVCRILAHEEINIECVSSESIGEFGFARLFTSNPDLSEKLLRAEGYPVTTSEYLQVQVENRPGELARVCEALGDATINIEGLFGTTTEGAETPSRLLIRVDDPIEAGRVLEQATARTVTH